MSSLAIYRSSAGSGKTYTLVLEYLKLVLKNPSDYKHILAVTFTNKATEEMKTRIIDSLRGLSEAEHSAKAKVLAEQLIAAGIKTDIRIKSQEVLNNILHDYSNFSVTTIDSFFHRIVRAFAYELNLQLGYNVEMDTDKVLNESVEKLMREVGLNNELTEYMEEFIISSLEEDKGWNIDKNIESLGGELLKERYYELKKRYKNSSLQGMSEFIKELKKNVSYTEKFMDSISVQAKNIMDEYGLTIDDFAYGKSGVANFLTSNICRNVKNYTIGIRAVDALNDPSKWHIQKSPKKSQIMDAVASGLQRLLEEAIGYYSENSAYYCTAKEVLKNIYVTGILNSLSEKIKEYRDENNVILIPDIGVILKEITGNNDAPFIFEKAGNRYRHFLLDEFQDTSNLQWKNILPLIRNGLAEGGRSLVVGDVKQSIYRWRNGNMKLLLNDVKNDINVYTEHELNVNRRSGKVIVDFNNEFFRSAPDVLIDEEMRKDKEELYGEYSELIRDTFQGAEQTAVKEGGYVNISFIPLSDDENPDLSARERTLLKAKDVIEEAVNDGYSYNDILILVSRNSEGAEVSEFLLSQSIKVISAETLLLKGSKKVQFLISLLKYIAFDGEYIARTHILHYYLHNISKADISIHDVLSDWGNENGSVFKKNLEQLFTQKLPLLNSLSMYEMTEELIRMFFLNREADAYLQRFQDAVLEFLSEGKSNLTDFLEWWEEKKDKLTLITTEQEDAVNIMTIHKAKGLEKPVVIIPFAASRFFDSGKAGMWAASDEKPFDKSSPYYVKPSSVLKNTYFRGYYYEEKVLCQIDSLNLLYVAFTRASERLFVLACENSDSIYNSVRLIKDTLIGNLTLLNNYDAERKIFETGIKVRKQGNRSSVSEDTFEIKEYLSSGWAGRFKVEPADIKTANIKNTFLRNTAKQISEDKNLDNACIVFPTRRACEYTSIHLKEYTDTDVSIYSIQDFISSIAPNIRPAEELQLVIELFNIYKKTEKKAELGRFYSLGKAILRDFDTIDKHLIDTEKLFRNIKSLKELEEMNDITEDLIAFREFWKTFSGKEISVQQKEFIRFWEIQSRLYTDFKKELRKKGLAYEGMIHRDISENMERIFSGVNFSSYHFAGFNYLTGFEKKLFSFLEEKKNAKFYWDTDEYYIKEKNQEAGKFIRKNITDYRNSAVTGSDLLTSKKNISVYGSPLLIGQVKALSEKLKEIGNDAGSSVIVLLNEDLLSPLLNSLPSNIKDINVTMGIPLKSAPLYGLIELAIRLRNNSKFIKDERTFYYKDITQVLLHPYVKFQDGIESKRFIDEMIVKAAASYISAQDIKEYFNNNIINSLFSSGNEKLCGYLKNILKAVEEPAVTGKATGRSIINYEQFSYVKKVLDNTGLLLDDDKETGDELKGRLILERLSLERIPFGGDLNGLQIMGMLETRCLDFRNVFILSMNEGIFPSGNKESSTIPYSLRRGFRLPSYEDEDAMSAYNFYRLLQRAENVHLFYNSHLDKLHGGEKSRFLMQLEYELAPENKNITFSKKSISIRAEYNTGNLIEIKKSGDVIRVLERSGISPSSLSTYINCQLEFYFRYICGLEEKDELAETIDPLIFGNILHKAVSRLYGRFIGKKLTKEKLELLKGEVEKAVNGSIREEFREEGADKGRDLLMKKVLTKLVNNIIEKDKEDLENGPILIKHLEEKFTKKVQIAGIELTIKGLIDRVDEQNGITRIIDYKTGKVDLKKRSSRKFDGISDEDFYGLYFTDGSFRQNLQLDMYSYLYLNNNRNEKVITGIYPLKTYTSKIDFLAEEPYGFSDIQPFTNGLMKCLEEIADPEIPFRQIDNQENCIYCSYKCICGK